MRILVTGASGLLGLNFLLQYAGQHEVIGIANLHRLVGLPCELRIADLSIWGEIGRLVSETRPDLVIHCAAIANLEAAEADPALAKRVNADLAGEAAQAARNAGAQFIQISTDAVFDGLMGGYSEDDPPNPINIYAATKLQGERAVLAAYPEALVARVNFFGFSLNGKRSLGEFFINNLKDGKMATGFTDVYFCPLQVNVLAGLLLQMAQKNLGGLYHVLSSECLSKYDFGCRIARRFGWDESLVAPVSWRDIGLKAPRSPNLTLRTDKLAQALGAPPPGQAQGIDLFARQWQDGYPQVLRSFGIS
jgi:dTDP-4-dehydrorhamnose reductase